VKKRNQKELLKRYVYFSKKICVFHGKKCKYPRVETDLLSVCYEYKEVHSCSVSGDAVVLRLQLSKETQYIC
jgi:hypothetical protein